jgi:predicted esterase
VSAPADGAQREREPRVRERLTQRTARYVLLGAEPAQADRIWFALHGYGMLAARFARPFQGVIPDDTCVVVPEALSRFYLEMPRADGSHTQRIGAAWLTRESRETEIDDAHHWLDLVHDEVVAESTAAQARPPVIGVLGFSQGVATATRWIASGRVAPTQFVVWAGSLAHDVDRGAFIDKMQDAELVFVTGSQDPFVTADAKADTLSMVMALSARHRVLDYEGAHHLDAPLLQMLLAGLGSVK